jgi:hypothetical protein
VPEAAGRRRWSVVDVANVVLAGMLFVGLVWFAIDGDSAAQRAWRRLQTGQSHDEVLQILEGVDYDDEVSSGSGALLNPPAGGQL